MSFLARVHLKRVCRALILTLCGCSWHPAKVDAHANYIRSLDLAMSLFSLTTHQWSIYSLHDQRLMHHPYAYGQRALRSNLFAGQNYTTLH